MTGENVQIATNPLWSATPTPLTEEFKIDVDSTARLVEHHLRLGVDGLFIIGSCGEGPWLPREQQRIFIREVCRRNDGRMTIGAQVTDNSAPRIIENAQMAADEGADVAIMAAPFKLMGPLASSKLLDLYLDAIEGSPLPVGIYDLGTRDKTLVPLEVVYEALRHPKVVALKDSSAEPERQAAALTVRADRPELRVMSGDEFDLPKYLGAGYDGLVLGGAIFNGALARQIMDAIAAGEMERAQQMQDRMNALMYDVYGGETISCWLAGLKHLLVRMGIFSTHANLLGYELSDDCATRIESALEQYDDVLFPEE
ncbi:MAG: dihydrodipicolinate synthase family protein [candidate division WS1 bacterium]|jgi:4-hydroxy-tetrahydrodipicolinate synthase|nr:dihydrodipicolinate synthase family protein [candidate division WS1 bacterium]